MAPCIAPPQSKRQKTDMAAAASLDGKVDTLSKSASPIPESTPLRMT